MNGDVKIRRYLEREKHKCTPYKDNVRKMSILNKKTENSRKIRLKSVNYIDTESRNSE